MQLQVSSLAAQSAKAAVQSKELIDDTVSKAMRGNEISVETSNTFEKKDNFGGQESFEMVYYAK